MTRLRLVAGWVVALILLAATLGPTSHAQQMQGDPFRCVVAVSTATTITAIGGDCAARPGLTPWITDISFSTNAAGITADSFNTLKYATAGSSCATAAVVFWGAMTAAATQATATQSFTTPLRLIPNVDLCWINSTAGSKFLVIAGFYKP